MPQTPLATPACLGWPFGLATALRTIRKVKGVESGGGWFLACKNFFLAVCLCKKGAIIFRLIATLCRNYFSAKFASSTITVVCMVRKLDGQQSER